MASADLKRFEAEGGVWGQQRSIRRNQVSVSVASALVSGLGGVSWAKFARGNTIYVVAGTFPIFACFGAVAGHALGISAFPSVADNKETTMMRYTWWAKECSKNWDLSQVDESRWKAQCPKSNLGKQ